MDGVKKKEELTDVITFMAPDGVVFRDHLNSSASPNRCELVPASRWWREARALVARTASLPPFLFMHFFHHCFWNLFSSMWSCDHCVRCLSSSQVQLASPVRSPLLCNLKYLFSILAIRICITTEPKISAFPENQPSCCCVMLHTETQVC